jgi:hypothetical protein
MRTEGIKRKKERRYSLKDIKNLEEEDRKPKKA